MTNEYTDEEIYQDILSGDALTNGYHFEEFFNMLKTGDCWRPEFRVSEFDRSVGRDDGGDGGGD